MKYPIYNKTLSYDDKFVKYWLLGLLLLLLLMILIGGLTKINLIPVSKSDFPQNIKEYGTLMVSMHKTLHKRN